MRLNWVKLITPGTYKLCYYLPLFLRYLAD